MDSYSEFDHFWLHLRHSYENLIFSKAKDNQLMTSVADILKKHGKWLETSVLVKKISRELHISERQAYRVLNRAWKNREIVKVSNPDRTVYCGLPEFGPLASSSGRFQEVFLLRCFKLLDRANEKFLKHDYYGAFQELFILVKTLPPHMRDKLEPEVQQVEQKIFSDILVFSKEYRDHEGDPDYQNRVDHMVKGIPLHYVPDLVGKFSAVLHEEFQKGGGTEESS